MLRIDAILVHPDPDPALFVSDLHDANQHFFGFLLLESTGKFTSFFTDKKPQRSHKEVEIKGFRTIFS